MLVLCTSGYCRAEVPCESEHGDQDRCNQWHVWADALPPGCLHACIAVKTHLFVDVMLTCGQSADMTTTLGEMQLQPALEEAPNTIVCAAFAISTLVHFAGVMNTGVTLPSSDVKGADSSGVLHALRWAPSFCPHKLVSRQ